MRTKLGKCCMAAGLILLLAAFGLCIMNFQEDQQAGSTSEQILVQLEQQLQQEENTATEESILPDPYDTEMTELDIDGEKYIGTLSIPSLYLKLPVMSDWSYEKLKTAPCRYSGSLKTDDLVIMAHNYRQHFGQLGNVKTGAFVVFVDTNNLAHTYEVVSVEVLPPDAIEDMTAGDFDLTLFTCTYDGSNRITLRCEKSEMEAE